ncbi:hypothetical protein GCM10022416_27610 [Actinomadura keratinilytica]|jgi:hypothetical protein|uniref:Uncharacterized protein n=1 Tax=Actinomadura keratinilytica TaxID=547461 RepID=A0ABP7YS15_9ACTN
MPVRVVRADRADAMRPGLAAVAGQNAVHRGGSRAQAGGDAGRAEAAADAGARDAPFGPQWLSLGPGLEGCGGVLLGGVRV